MNFKLILGLLIATAVLTAAQADCVYSGGCEYTYYDTETELCYDDDACTETNSIVFTCNLAPSCDTACSATGYMDGLDNCYTVDSCNLDNYCDHCIDLIKDIDETDVDCGGGNCDGCAEGDDCLTHYDCAGLNCDGGVCGEALSSCTDGIINQGETRNYLGKECGGLYCDTCLGIDSSVAGQFGDIGSPSGVTTDGTYIWVSNNTNDYVYKYNMDGTYTGSSFYIGDNVPKTRGLTTDGTYIWMIDTTNSGHFTIHKYTVNGVYEGLVVDIGNSINSAYGLTTNGTNIWVTVANAKTVRKYTMAGAFVDSFSTGSITPHSIATDGTYIWLLNQPAAKVYKFNMNGTDTGLYLSTGHALTNNIDIYDGTFFATGEDNPRIFTFPVTKPGYRMVLQGSADFQLSDGTVVTDPSNLQTGTKYVYVRDVNSGSKVGFLEVDFDAATGDITAEDLTVATDAVEGKALMHHDAFTDPSIINGYILVPWLGAGYEGYHCPSATSLGQITEACSGKTTGYTTLVNILGVDYIQMPNQGGGNGPGGSSVPEFSDIAYVLAAVLGAGGFVLIRKMRKF